MKSLKQLAEKLIFYLSKYNADKFTGKITFTFHFKSGGIGRTQINVEHDFDK